MLKNKKSEILEEEIIYIILTVVFFSLLAFFLLRSNPSSENVAKQIVLVIDASKPETKIVLNADKLVEMAEEKKIARESIVRIEGNQVVVRLSDKNEGKYSFFTRAEVKTYFEGNNLVVEVK